MENKQSVIMKIIEDEINNDLITKEKQREIMKRRQNCLNKNNQQFHLDCPLTRLKICFCDNLLSLQQSVQTKQLENDL